MGGKGASECRVCGLVFYGTGPGDKAPVHTSGRYNKKCPGSRQGTTIHVP